MKYSTKERKGHRKRFSSYIPKKQKGIIPTLKEMGNLVNYKPGSLTLEVLRETFKDVLYPDNNKVVEDNRKVNIYIVGTEKQCRNTLKMFDDALREEGRKYLR